MAGNYVIRTVHALNHEKSYREAVQLIDEAVGRALPSKKKYDCVRVLSLRWDNDDRGLADIEAEFLGFFKNKFHYATESILIPSSSARDATLAIRQKLQNLISKYDSPSTLLIIVYGGHSSADYDKPISPLHIMGSMTARVSVPWAFIEADLMAIADADVLIILDSCFSTGEAMGPGDFEYLAASAFESPAAAQVEVSLTRRFIDLLNNMDTEEITIAQMHAKLVEKANHPNSNLDYTPVHVASATKPSITLRPLQILPREVAGLRKMARFSDGKVLASVLVEGTTIIPDIEVWTKWLSTSIPDDVADIKVEAVFDSSSSLCLLTMPIAVWDMMKGNESYHFVSYVESHNLLLRRPSTPADVGALGSRSGNIDIPHRDKE